MEQNGLNGRIKKQNQDKNKILVADRQSQISLYEQMVKGKRGDQQELKLAFYLMYCAELAKNG